MTLEIQAWNRHNSVAGFNRFIDHAIVLAMFMLSFIDHAIVVQVMFMLSFIDHAIVLVMFIL
jgi:membrane protein implicated in regulation of membrane protease activity